MSLARRIWLSFDCKELSGGSVGEAPNAWNDRSYVQRGGRTMLLDKLIARLKEYFAKRPEVAVAYLFGSVARGKARPGSDIDIAVLFVEQMSPFDRFEKTLNIAVELEGLLLREVDIIDLESADPYFIHQVMLHKILILDKDTQRRVVFEVENRRVFFDRQRFYDQIGRASCRERV